ncbi:hypothetical protein KBY72_13925 [Cyanobium sp. BA5m-21]|uniref:hypothetical protein n=1 Tax=unclassified Cyanobium TaxID=2627006 RepID=UPI0020CE3782|nr:MULTISPECIES: hypothetical protein [unclassified Cyanobium]MCP9903120.1 hypothetical protein [Cyanobium sp. BA5m-10]MCP9908257.1 hypothetical protein [Cyanobium sp. BA5m-21]
MVAAANARVCQKPDGKHYGISDDDRCAPPAKEARSRPDTGFLNTQAGRGMNYDTAKKQGDKKTAEAVKKKEALNEFKRLKNLAGHQWALDKVFDKYGGGWLNSSGVRDEIDRLESKEEANERKK